MVNLNFSRQHHARVREHNHTHAVITLLDNAIGQDKQTASSEWSRALTVSLRFDTMTAELISSIDHPQRNLTFRRGSHQILPNGNSFVGWSERCLHSEHTADGELVMEAEVESEQLGECPSIQRLSRQRLQILSTDFSLQERTEPSNTHS